MPTNLLTGSTVFFHKAIQEKQAFLGWDIDLSVKRPQKDIWVLGISMFFFEEKVTFQRDYFDAGELFYERVTLLGSFIRLLKKKIGA